MQPKMSDPATTTLAKIAERIRHDARAVLLVRHAERPPLSANDPTFGRDLPLTRRGVRDAMRFGRRMIRIFGDVEISLAAGANRRCMETAFCILRGMRLDWEDEGCAVSADPYLGGRSYYFADVAERMKLAGEGNYIESLNTYFKTGRQRGFSPLAPSTSLLVGHLLWHYDAHLFVGVTHDINVACFLAGNGAVDSFTTDSWPHFLDAAVLIASPDGNTECRRVVHA